MEVDPAQCTACGYRFTDCHGGMIGCQYILVTGKRRPAPDRGRCIVRIESAVPFPCVTPRKEDGADERQ